MAAMERIQTLVVTEEMQQAPMAMPQAVMVAMAVMVWMLPFRVFLVFLEETAGVAVMVLAVIRQAAWAAVA